MTARKWTAGTSAVANIGRRAVLMSSPDDDGIEFGILHPDGSLTNERTIARATILACPFVVIAQEHYADDGTCGCYTEAGRAHMVREWGYTVEDFRRKGLVP